VQIRSLALMLCMPLRHGHVLETSTSRSRKKPGVRAGFPPPRERLLYKVGLNSTGDCSSFQGKSPASLLPTVQVTPVGERTLRTCLAAAAELSFPDLLPGKHHESWMPTVQVTPVGERTMRTCLAAAAELSSPDLLPDRWADGATLVHFEGYVMYKPAFAAAAMRAARSAGALVRPLHSTPRSNDFSVIASSEERAIRIVLWPVWPPRTIKCNDNHNNVRVVR
jgi:hypothetical protein